MNKEKYYYIKTINKENIPIYNQAAFSKLRDAGQLAKNTLNYLAQFVKIGIQTEELDELCSNYISTHKALSATLNYNGYPKSCCISINHEICHGIPNSRKLENGDIVNIDVTVILDGWYGDTSRMFAIGKISPVAEHLMHITQKSLNLAIENLKPEIKLGEIGHIISTLAHQNGYSVVEEFCGHGIGHVFHQDPQVLHISQPNEGVTLKPGMVFTIEPMINAGAKETEITENNWTAITKDRSLSAQYEHMVGITKNGYINFTA